MNLATFIALIVILALFIPAARYCIKNGTCGSCPDHGSCSGHCSSMNIKKDSCCKEKSDIIDEIIKKHSI